jgi:hypothetical protein
MSPGTMLRGSFGGGLPAAHKLWDPSTRCLNPSFSEPGSLSLQEMIRTTSLTELGLGGTHSLSDLASFNFSFRDSKGDLGGVLSQLRDVGGQAGGGHHGGAPHDNYPLDRVMTNGSELRLSQDLKLPSDLRMTSDLRTINESEMSISGLLNESAHEIVSGLAKRTGDSFGRQGGQEPTHHDQFMDIMSDFGPGSSKMTAVI